MRSVQFPLFWWATGLINITLSRIKVFVSFFEIFLSSSAWFISYCFVRVTRFVRFLRPVARQNSGNYTLRMILKVAYWDGRRIGAPLYPCSLPSLYSPRFGRRFGLPSFVNNIILRHSLNLYRHFCYACKLLIFIQERYVLIKIDEKRQQRSFTSYTLQIIMKMFFGSVFVGAKCSFCNNNWCEISIY